MLTRGNNVLRDAYEVVSFCMTFFENLYFIFRAQRANLSMTTVSSSNLFLCIHEGSFIVCFYSKSKHLRSFDKSAGNSGDFKRLEQHMCHVRHVRNYTSRE